MKTFIKRNRAFILGCLIIYVGFLAFLGIYQRSFIYFPSDIRPVIARFEDVPRDFVVRTSDNLELTGLYWPPATPEDLTFIFFHGNAQDYGFYLSLARDYTSAGYGFLLAEYRGFGGNPGVPTEQGLYRDARAYISALNELEDIVLADMVLLGFSLGSGVAVQMAIEYEDIRALILQAFYNAMSEVAKRQYWMFPVDWVMRDQYRSLDKIGQIKMPVLMIHGERDSIIPVALAQSLYDAAPQPKTFIRLPQAGHNDLYYHGAKDHTLEFIVGLDNP